MSYQEHFAKHLRISLLRLLNEAPSCRANSSILASAVQSLGLTATRDQVKMELAWLTEQRLLTTEDLGDLLGATLTERGCDGAEGRAVVPGVQRPTPRG